MASPLQQYSRYCAKPEFMLKRRFILALCAAFVALSLSAAEPVPLSENLTHEGFLAHLGERFRVWGGSGLRRVVELELIEVEDLALSEQLAQFSVIFRGPGDYPLEKDGYTFEHPRSGRFKLFIEPAGEDSQGRLYQVDFNLLRLDVE